MQSTLLLFAAGVVAFQFAPTLPSVLTLALAAPAALLVLFGQPARAVGAFAIGLLWAAVYAHMALNHRADDLEGTELAMTGQVVSIPEEDMRRVRFVFKVHAVEQPLPGAAWPERILLHWYGRYPRVEAGEIWRLRVRLRASTPPTPEYDEQRWRYLYRIHAAGTVLPGDAERLGQRWNLARLRSAIGSRILEQVDDPRYAGLLIGLVVGDRQYIDAQSWHVFSVTGTGHLLAISGLHVGMLAGLGMLLIGRAWRYVPALCRRVPAQVAGALAGMTAGVSYAALAGFALPTQRAVIMLAVVCIALLRRRFIHPWQALLLALAAVLAWDPAAPLSGGFWLSFCAVAAILVTANGYAPEPRWRSGLRIQLVISIALLPLLILWFRQLPLSSPLANFVAIPAVASVVVPAALLGTALLYVLEPLGAWILWGASVVLKLVLYLLEWMAPFSLEVGVSAYPLWALFCATAGALLLLAPRGVPGRLLAVPLLAPLLLMPADRPAEAHAWVQASQRELQLQTRSGIVPAGAATHASETCAEESRDGLRIRRLGSYCTLLLSTGKINVLMGPAYALEALVAPLPEPVQAVVVSGGSLRPDSFAHFLTLAPQVFSLVQPPPAVSASAFRLDPRQRLEIGPEGIRVVTLPVARRYYHDD